MMTMDYPKSETKIAPDGLTELVRGCERRIYDCVAPLVRSSDVILDCSAIERIDAAGIATLISLYGTARDAGNNFAVSNLRSHVAEILALVGLDRVLVAPDTARNVIPICCARTAA
ncbi:MAG TPA: STAS domain-containing protein [Bryobacteraceae bacterium]|nr:STAS domain-containing protein [Bryobacteraceae bacterium]